MIAGRARLRSGDGLKILADKVAQQVVKFRHKLLVVEDCCQCVGGVDGSARALQLARLDRPCVARQAKKCEPSSRVGQTGVG